MRQAYQLKLLLGTAAFESNVYVHERHITHERVGSAFIGEDIDDCARGQLCFWNAPQPVQNELEKFQNLLTNYIGSD